MGQLAITMGVSIGLQLIGGLLAPTVQGPRLSDLSVTASTYGNAIPRLYGTARMGGNVIWSLPIKEHKHKSGKGMQSEATYTYTCSFAVALCQGPVEGITRVWADSKLIYGDNSGDQMKDLLEKVSNGQITVTQYVAQQGLFKSKQKADNIVFRVYNGSEDQQPDPLIVADRGADLAPAHRGLCYIIFQDLPLANYGNRIPSISCEVAVAVSGAVPRLDPIYGGFIPDSRACWIDWDASQFYKFNSATNELVTYDLDSHAMISRVVMPYGLGGGWTIGPNAGPIICMDGRGGASNSQPMWVMYPNGEGASYGHDTNGLYDGVTLACTPYDVTTNPAFCSGIFDIMCFYTIDEFGTQTNYFLHVSAFSAYSIWNVGSQDLPAMTPLTVADAPIGNNIYSEWGNLIRGAVTPEGTDIWWWRGDNGKVQLHRTNILPGDAGFVTNGFDEVNQCYGGIFTPSPFVTDSDYEIGEVAGYQNFVPNFVLADSTDNTLNMVGTYVNYGSAADGSGASYPGFLKWSVDDAAVKLARVWDQATDNNGYDIILGYCQRDSRLQGGKLGWISWPRSSFQSCATTVDLTTGDISSSPFTDTSAAYGYMICLQGQATSGVWDDVTQSFWCVPVGEDMTRYFFRSVGSDGSLADIVEDICVATTALTAADIDVSQLSGISVPGYVISNNSSAKDALTQLSQAYFFDGVESDNILKFVLRGSDPVASITEDDLGVVSGEVAAGVKETATQEFELPMRITFNYYSIERDYQTGSQYAKRVANPVPSMYSPNLVKTELPIVLDADTAKQMADKMLKMSWANRTTISCTFPWKYILLDPTDVVAITNKNNIKYTVRIQKLDMGADLTLQMTGVTERSDSYVSNVTGDAGTIVLQSPSGAAPVNLLVANTPLLRDADDTQGSGSLTYVGITDKTASPGSGATIEQSLTGKDYTVATSIASSVASGTCQNVLGYTRSSEATDWTNELRVALRNKQTTLESISYADMLAGGNAALVGAEVIQYQNAVLGTDGIWTLSGLLRGRRGTTYAIKGHGVAETFVVLDQANMDTLTRTSDNYTATYAMKAVPPGTADADVKATKVSLEPNDLKPYTPEALKCVTTATGTTVTWQRRSRITATLRDGDPEVSYFEGQGPNAQCKWEAYLEGTVTDATILADTATPTISGTSMVYNADGTFAAMSATIDFSSAAAPAAGTRLSFVFRVWEVGFVAGFPKIVRFDAPLDETGAATTGQWAYTELY